MAPIETNLRGFLSSTRQQFLPIRTKHRNKWVTKFQCVYPGCTKRKSVLGELQPQRLETTHSQIYAHAMRFHKPGGADIEKLTKKEVDNELHTTGANIKVMDFHEKSGGDGEPPRASTSVKKSKTPQVLKGLKLKPLNDWKALL